MSSESAIDIRKLQAECKPSAFRKVIEASSLPAWKKDPRILDAYFNGGTEE